MANSTLTTFSVPADDPNHDLAPYWIVFPTVTEDACYVDEEAFFVDANLLVAQTWQMEHKTESDNPKYKYRFFHENKEIQPTILEPIKKLFWVDAETKYPIRVYSFD